MSEEGTERRLLSPYEEIADLRKRLESIALITAYDEPLPGSLVGHVKVIVSDFLDTKAKLEQAQTEASQSALTLQTQVLEARAERDRLQELINEKLPIYVTKIAEAQAERDDWKQDAEMTRGEYDRACEALNKAQARERRLYRAARAYYDNASAENLMVLGDALAEPTP